MKYDIGTQCRIKPEKGYNYGILKEIKAEKGLERNANKKR